MWNPLHTHDDTDEVEAMILDSQYVDIPVELIESLPITPTIPPDDHLWNWHTVTETPNS